MDLPLLMVFIFSAGAVTGLLAGGIRRRPAGFEQAMAALREENDRLRHVLGEAAVPSGKDRWS